MHDTHEVISAFLDGEPFDPDELSVTLSEQGGREMLIDLAGLRQIVQPAAMVTAHGRSATAATTPADRPRRTYLYWAAAAAALVAALLGGFVAGTSRTVTTQAEIEAPEPTRVVVATVATESPFGGVR